MRFGFREFWIDGRDFFLNGTRIFLSAVPLDNAQIGAGLASYEGARESLERLKSFGINFVYTHNYGCEPGSHLSFAEILRAADDVGMLVAFSQPHFSHYDWKSPTPIGQRLRPACRVLRARWPRTIPRSCSTRMSHNATGYDEDMNPDMIDGLHDPRDAWALNNAKLALRAEAIVRHLDPGRIVYHHASGNLGSMHTSNFYPNFAPIQELSDWFEHWATKGVKPVFTCEYGAPFTWDWAMYRGWYKGERTFGSARVPWEFCFAEWNAQFLGDRAFRSARWRRRTCAGRPSSSRRQPLASLGLSLRDWIAALRRPARGDRQVSHRQLAGLPHLGRLGELAVGTRALLETARRRRQTPQGVAGGLGPPSAAGVQSRLHRSAVRATWTWPSSDRTGSRRRTGRPCCATTGRCWPTSAASPATSPARTTTSARAKRSRSRSSSSTIPARP